MFSTVLSVCSTLGGVGRRARPAPGGLGESLPPAGGGLGKAAGGEK